MRERTDVVPFLRASDTGAGAYARIGNSPTYVVKSAPAQWSRTQQENHMRAKQWMQITALAAAIGFAGTTYAATDATTSPLGKTPESTTGANNQSPRLPDLNAWTDQYGTAHNGRITREEFMDEMSQRWDTLDSQRRGYMTPDEVRGIYSTDQANRPARTGSEVTPGYMGPGSSKGK